MKLGVIARADRRGLAHVTWEAARHLAPERVLLVDMGRLSPGAIHRDWYDDPTVVQFDGTYLPEAEVRRWLAGLDVIYTAETPYDWRLPGWAREAGVGVVVHVMPEFWKAELRDSNPTAWWNPTSWRRDTLPESTRLVPVPYPVDRFGPPAELYDGTGPLRVLHPAGKLAAWDRNGTRLLFQALRGVRRPVHVTVTSQDGMVPRATGLPANVTVDVVKGDRPEYWTGYADHHLMVLPRRYGGLCLPALEGAAAGLGLVMPDCSPNGSLPLCAEIGGTWGETVAMPCGPVRLFQPNYRHLALALNELADDPELVRDGQARAWGQAQLCSWEALTGLWHAELGAAAVP